MRLQIDDHEVEVEPGLTVLDAARSADIYIPRLCWHVDLPPGRTTRLAERVFQGDTELTADTTADTHAGCGLCVVEIEHYEDPVPACDTAAEEDMVVRTTSETLTQHRRASLGRILLQHPHACLTCAQQEGCSRTQCSANVPENERCCPLLGRCELQKVAALIGIPEDLPRYRPVGRPVVCDEPLFIRDYNLCIACTRCVRVCNDLRGVGALDAVSISGRTFVGMNGASAASAGCRFCGSCVEVCPTGALTDRDRTTISTDDTRLASCRSACPAGIDVPRYLRHVAAGRFDEANAVVREKVPFPGVLGHVCFHPCEEVCQRGEVNTPVSICALKRSAAQNDTGLWKKNIRQPEPNGTRVAVVGAGPAGLTAAYFLARKGHGVVVFETLPEPGGMLRYGILPFRLPKDVLKDEIDEIVVAGVELRGGARVSMDELHADGYDAVLLATGAHAGKPLPIEGADLDGIVQGIRFLRNVASGGCANTALMGKHAVVVGGGNVAVDAARAIRRLGATAVHMVCLERRTEMPAYESEVDYAMDEGITLHTGWGPKRFLGNVAVNSVELRRCTRVFDEEKRFDPLYDNALAKTLEADVVVLAIGQACNLDYLGQSGVDLGPSGTIEAGESTQTSVSGVFAAGDVRRGPASVIDAITDGRRAAESIDRYLGGDGRIDEPLIAEDTPDPYLGPGEGFADRGRVDMPLLAADQRKAGFCTVELGYDPAQAASEARRCLQCDLRTLLRKVEWPPDRWLPFDAGSVGKVPPELEGVYVLADSDKRIVKIKGTGTLQADLLKDIERNGQARYFRLEEDPMYTKRESELLQQYMQEHGQMPRGEADELDELF